ncbi:sugar kinase [Vibrio casei]|uniref:2-dehydro-3-deoxygluconokinase n=1 Tax=Vibrio casei TaxID=673372 RepID=A0A368LH68_9VIBR|nr:sugar kinase [Vibrio casei]RCS69966.1 sugar kinase [Vibrio casei]SJN29034.1 2-dehydro-3-deoxygluconate kinase [Vibrio casei]
MTTFNIAVIGECMIELQQSGDFLSQRFGGDTLNTALYLARLTKHTNIKTSYVTALGHEGFSQNMIDSWIKEAIDTQHILRLENKQPGMYYIETDNAGERSFYYWRNDAAAKYMFDQNESAQLIEKLSKFDAVYLSGITLAILTEQGREQLFILLGKVKANGGKVIFDNNFRPKLWPSIEKAQQAYLKTLSFCDIALLTFDDEQDLFGDEDIEQCIARTQGQGVQEIAIKRGSKDCIVIEADSIQYIPTKPVDNVIDTTAAGDSFSAGYLAKRLNGHSAKDSALLGHKVAGTVIQHQGAIIPNVAMHNVGL